jgi:hypothetical protein
MLMRARFCNMYFKSIRFYFGEHLFNFGLLLSFLWDWGLNSGLHKLLLSLGGFVISFVMTYQKKTLYLGADLMSLLRCDPLSALKILEVSPLQHSLPKFYLLQYPKHYSPSP